MTDKQQWETSWTLTTNEWSEHPVFEFGDGAYIEILEGEFYVIIYGSDLLTNSFDEAREYLWNNFSKDNYE